MIKTAGLQLSLILSALVHLALFSSFIIVFFIPSAPMRPEFMFLGSILQKADVRETNTSLQPTSAKDVLKIHSIEKIYDIGDPASLSKDPTSKPILQKEKSSQEKRVLKSRFPSPELEGASQEQKELDIQTESIPYIPLRLKKDD